MLYKRVRLMVKGLAQSVSEQCQIRGVGGGGTEKKLFLRPGPLLPLLSQGPPPPLSEGLNPPLVSALLSSAR